MNVVVDPLMVCLQGLLPSARLRETELSLSEPLRLMLIDPEGMDVPLSNEETNAIFEAPPYWSFCWGSGRAMAQHLLNNPRLVAGKSVLDFGCGSGVVAIAAAMAGAASVVACDSDSVALEAALINAQLNDCHIEVLSNFKELNSQVDLLLAADVLYDSDNLPLLQLFRRCSDSVLLADSRVRNLRESGYTLVDATEAVTVPDLGESDTVKIVRFYQAEGYGAHVQPNP